MLTLYIKTGCPFCVATQAKITELDLKVEEKNIIDDILAEELIACGGKNQVPYLIDTDRDIEMYESGDIVEYLDKFYGSGESKKEVDNNKPQVCTLEF
jgi:glutaredoxin